MYLFIPDIYVNDKSHSGYGHLIRCLRIALETGGEVLLDEIQQEISKNIITQFTTHFPEFSRKVRIVSELPREHYNLIIIDKKEVSVDFIQNFSYYGITIGIDTGGDGRLVMPYLIDTLPNMFSHEPNVSLLGSSLNPRLKTKYNWSYVCHKIIYYTSGSTNEEEQKFIKSILDTSIMLTVVTSNTLLYEKLNQEYKNLTVARFDIRIMDNLAKFDLLITHFGITAYESIYARVPVVLSNPTQYHTALSKLAKFPQIFTISHKKSTQHPTGYMKLSEYINTIISNELEYVRLIQDTQEMKNVNLYTKNKKNEFLSHIIQELADNLKKSHSNFIINPWLGLETTLVAHRNRDKTIFSCERTKQYYQIPFSDDFPNYDTKYFFSKYKEQYGKTYMEDFMNIHSLMQKRMHYIQKYIAYYLGTKKTKHRHPMNNKRISHYYESKDNPYLCDIGSAYGVMLKVAKEYGYNPVGIEINNEAIKYSNEVLQVLSIRGNVMTQRLSSLIHKAKVDANMIHIITCFYLIEYLPNIQLLLDDIHTLLPEGGMFVCAVPNGSGISARTPSSHFFENYPIDHFGIFTPKGLKRILTNAGFKIMKIRNTGHHPERFRVPKILHPLLLFFSHVCRLGDTFEVYARKQW